MPTATDLMEMYKLLLNKNTEEIGEESASVLFKNDWVRIMLVRSVDPSILPILEIEVSPPQKSSRASFGQKEAGAWNEGGAATHFLQDMIRHLEYLLCLERLGFSVDYTEDGCLFIAFRKFEQTPDVETFQFLLPPSAQSDKTQ